MKEIERERRISEEVEHLGCADHKKKQGGKVLCLRRSPRSYGEAETEG